MNTAEIEDILRKWSYASFGRIADYYIPEALWFKKVVANMENYNKESFRWAVTRSLNPVDKDPQWITTGLRNQTDQYNWDGLSFPTPLSQIEIFEKNNDVLVNVFKWDEFTERAYPIRVPFGKHNPRALLILIDEDKGHYVVIKSMQGLFRKQTGRAGKTFYCNNCLMFFPSDKPLQRHIACCDRVDHLSLEELSTPKPRTKPRSILKPKTRPNAGMVNGRALNNMKCSDAESFKWAVVRSLNPVDVRSERVTQILKEQSKKYNWDGISFPTPLSQIRIFEKSNNVFVNVFEWDKERDRVYPISVSVGEYEGRAFLVFVDDHYAVVKTISRLLGSQAAIGRRHCEKFFCSNCLENFTNKEKHNDHILRLCEFAFTSELKEEGDVFYMSRQTFSDSEQEDDFNEYIARKINDDSYINKWEMFFLDITVVLTLRLLNIHEEANLVLMIISNLWIIWNLLRST